MVVITLSVPIVSQVMKPLLLNFSLSNKSAHHTESLVEYEHAAVGSISSI